MYLPDISKIKLICNFILSPLALLTLFSSLNEFEKLQLPTSFTSLLSNSSLRNCFLGLLVSLVIYFILALYLDNVLPQGNNYHRKWYFFITDLFHICRSRQAKLVDDDVGHKGNDDNPFIQQDPEGLKKTVTVKKISKTFKVKGQKIEILKGINFNAYGNEIFAILGHNGAGKTTLMNIMTGILSASHGEVYFDNVAITVDVDSILKEINLLGKKNTFPNKLSGGQKRKLCITLALLGSPKYVFLDEPTTGLDPYSRKNIWELLVKKKNNCTMFITTHYMDEADLLADRKMIISNGNITCLGSSLFLKNCFNMNYALDIYAKDSKD
ncbi:P-loop containing nucleoside triphosphate hydrolase protein, partial [Anaeromyces robustus]